MSTGKTLSNGTLSLRFMQNAHRAKQQAAIDLERAKVRDEAEWEVSKEVREAWGLASSSNSQSGQAVAHETSYLPFLFPSLQNSGPSSNDGSAAVASPSSRISGRRTFTKGREVVSTPSSVDGPAGADIKQESNAAEPSEPLTEQLQARYTSGAGPLTKTHAHKLAERDRAGLLPMGDTTASDVSVLSMISEETSAVVGMDMRQMRKQKGKGIDLATTVDEVKPSDPVKDEPVSSIGKGPLSFLRPAGVDSPTGVDSPAPSSTAGKKNRKRERDVEAGEAGLGFAGKKADSESTLIADASKSQRQVVKKKKKQKKLESGLSTPTS